MKTITTCIVVGKDQWKALKKISRKNNISASCIVRTLLAGFLAKANDVAIPVLKKTDEVEGSSVVWHAVSAVGNSTVCNQFSKPD